MTNDDGVPQVGFVSLGCPKATVDSERLLTQLRAEGYGISPTYAGADLVIVNTCGFIDAAVEESLEAIAEALAENGRVIVTGCLGAREPLVRAAHPEVLAITGPQADEAVMAAVHAHLPAPHAPFLSLVPAQGVKLTPAHYAYLKIAEGCNHRCRFCIIPSLRGDLVSRPIGEVLDEAGRLVEAGVRELLIIAQDTSAYGHDRRGRPGFWGTRPLATDIVTLARTLGAFAYSAVAGAAANELPNPVPEPVKQERLAALMAVQAEISREKLTARVGQRLTVLVDAVESERVIARSEFDAPEIDGVVIVPGAWELEPGDFIEVEVTAAGDHDLWADPVVD